MADYSDLILELRSINSTVFEAKKNPNPAVASRSSSSASSQLRGNAADAAVIGFGGSYGGMLAAWMRMRYPSAVDGVVAASAPIWSYENIVPAFDSGSFAATVTDDAGPKGGSSEACSGNVREAWKVLFASVEEGTGRDEVTPAAASAALRLCPAGGQTRALATREDAQLVADWASSAFDSCAMGMFPYPSSYMLNGDAELPAWPLRAICSGKLSEQHLAGAAALEALAEGISVYFNATRDAVCYDPLGGGGSSSDSTDEDGSLWGWQYCSQVRRGKRERDEEEEEEEEVLSFCWFFFLLPTFVFFLLLPPPFKNPPSKISNSCPSPRTASETCSGLLPGTRKPLSRPASTSLACLPIRFTPRASGAGRGFLCPPRR